LARGPNFQKQVNIQNTIEAIERAIEHEEHLEHEQDLAEP
jgi:hypothetical protein